jgi:tetratricopeptide (TPR) repeat protein
MILFKAKKFPESMLAFSSFIERYADHPLAGSAQFYVGECYYRQKEYKLAVVEYQRVLTSYDRSGSLPETLKQMAQAEEHLAQAEDALKHRQLLLSLFPQSPAAHSVRLAHAEVDADADDGADPAAPGATTQVELPAPAAVAKPALPAKPVAGAVLDEVPPTAPIAVDPAKELKAQ